MTFSRYRFADPLTVEQAPGCETLRVPVLRVFDGDGFLTRIDFPRHSTSAELTIRLGFIDAPEMQQPGGPEARDFLASIIGGQSVDLVILTKMDTGQIVDRHGRIVAVPYLPPSSIGQLPRNVELEMVVNGWAWVLDRYEPDEIYFRALEDAQQHRRGIWAFDNNVHPFAYKRQQYAARQKARSGSQQASLFDQTPLDNECPNGCGGVQVAKSGRFGEFIGCSNFPTCRYTRNIT